MPLSLALDSRELAGKPTGVGRYLGELLSAWSTAPDARDVRFTLYTPVPLSAPGGAAVREVVLPGDGGTIWEQRALAAAVRRGGHDVLFAPGYTCPLHGPTPTVLVIHDLSFAAHPEWFNWREGARRRLITRLSAQKAALVLTVSDAARAEIIERLGVPPGRVRRIYHGISAARTPHDPGQPRQPLVLYVGSILNRRHVPDLLRAFEWLAARHPEPRLAIVGDNRTYPCERLQPPFDGAARERVAIHDYVDERTLADLYARARAFVFLSEYEGFGLTPLEALAARVPALVLDTPVAREVYGDAVLYVPSVERAVVGAALERLMFDERLREDLLSRAPGVLARYSWERAARETLEAIRSAAGRSAPPTGAR